MKRLARMMVALYPAWWGRCYGDGLEALIEDSGSGLFAAVDVLKEAMRMQIKTLSPGTLCVVLFGAAGWFGGGTIPLLIAMLASIFALLASIRSLLQRRIALGRTNPSMVEHRSGGVFCCRCCGRRGTQR